MRSRRPCSSGVPSLDDLTFTYISPPSTRAESLQQVLQYRHDAGSLGLQDLCRSSRHRSRRHPRWLLLLDRRYVFYTAFANPCAFADDHGEESPKDRPQPPAPEKAQQESRGPNTAIDPKTFTEFPISEKTQTSHNTAIYRFKLPTEDSILGLPIGQHISLAADLDVTDPKTGEVQNKEVVRSYTPISSDVTPGHFDLLIKSYPTGNISRHLATLNVGDKMKVRGPKGAMVYTPNMVRRFGMIAGGTGITPMLQVCQAIRRGRKDGDKTEVDLIFANVNEEDILLREDLDALAKEDGFNVYYVLNNPPSGWTGGVGFVTADMIKVSSC